MSALTEYKRSWNGKRIDDKYGPVPQESQEIIDKQIEYIEQTKSYVRSLPIYNKEKTVNPLCDFIKFFDNELSIFNVDGNKIHLMDVQIRELHKIHNNDKVKVNWTRQSGKDVIILSYLVYLATKGKRIFIDAVTSNHLKRMLDDIIDMCPKWIHDRQPNTRTNIYFINGGLITTSDRDSCDTIFSNEYDYNADGGLIHRPNFKKVIVVSKELNEPNYVESVINWNELPGRDECFKQKTIGSIGIDHWYKEFEVTGMCEEFTASNLRNIKNEIQNKTDHKVIEGIRQECIKRTKCGSDHYLYKFGLSCGVQEYLVKRGFNIEHDYNYCGRKYTKISW